MTALEKDSFHIINAIEITEFFKRRSKLFHVIFGFATNIFVGFFDYITGYEIGLSVFYLIPIGFVTWFVNRKAGIYMSVASTATIIISNFYAGQPYQHLFTEVWNLFIHFGFFVIFTFLFSKLKLDLEEQKKLVLELQHAFWEINTLSGLLPICASCKKIRDDKGYWNQIESYISKHSEVQFSHSVCPECIKKLYPEHSKKVLGNKEKKEDG
ncbi:MAG: hypothetical protein ACHQ0Y_00840 [Thermodesulfovibrionales bacterium]